MAAARYHKVKVKRGVNAHTVTLTFPTEKQYDSFVFEIRSAIKRHAGLAWLCEGLVKADEEDGIK